MAGAGGAFFFESGDAAEDADALADGKDVELFEGGEVNVEQHIALDVVLCEKRIG